MANTRNANTIFFDTAGASAAFTVKNLAVTGVMMESIGTSARLQLRDSTTSAVKVVARLSTKDESLYYDLSRAPIVFPNGIFAHAVGNCVAVVTVRETGQ